jgi:hypothetical protein
MQFAQEIIDNLEKRSRSVGIAQSHLTTFKLKTILLICLISFTSLLVRQTLQVQHSCNPMIHWSGKLPTECQVAVKTNFDSFDNFSYPRKQESELLQQQTQITQKIEEYESPNINSDLLGFTAGVATGAGVVVAAGATSVFSIPAAGAVLTGMGVWYVIKTVL